MKANPIHLLNIKREDIFRIHLTDVLWMKLGRNTTQVSSDMGFSFRTVLLREGNMNDVSS